MGFYILMSFIILCLLFIYRGKIYQLLGIRYYFTVVGYGKDNKGNEYITLNYTNGDLVRYVLISVDWYEITDNGHKYCGFGSFYYQLYKLLRAAKGGIYDNQIKQFRKG